MRRLFALASALLALPACIPPPSTTQRLTDAAIEMNTATRFGRMDVALDHVPAEERASFARRHAAWGGAIRVLDVEFGGLDLKKPDEAEVSLDVAWLRSNEATMRVTKITQRWRDNRGRWQLVDEERATGDVGLLGEPPAAAPPGGAAPAAPAAPLRALSRTHVIRGDE